MVLCLRAITWGNLGCSSLCGTIECTLAVRHAVTFLTSPDAHTTGLNRYFYTVLGCVKLLHHSECKEAEEIQQVIESTHM